MRRSLAALALIRHQDESGRTCWLVQWHAKWNAYALVGGHKRSDETFRQCLIREVTEELQLTVDIDFAVAPEPLAQLEYTAWSHSAGQDTQYTIELFDVELTAAARRKVDADPINRWLTEAEIRDQRTTDDNPVSETVGVMLNQVGC